MKLPGLYLHIPFCQSKCYYCDFYSVVSPARKSAFVDALLREIDNQSLYFGSKRPALSTVYFGGGTPSLLSEHDFSRIFNGLERAFDLSTCTEITLEANPDDLSLAAIDSLRRLPFNRISIGIQSFVDSELRAINRRHTAEAAWNAVGACFERGFANISIDLMYGLPGQTTESFEYSLSRALALPIQHISSYALSWEDGSVLYHRLQKGELRQASDEMLERCFFLMKDTLENAGFKHYELSNFARADFESRHNSLYWNGAPYLGLGPGAHSFDGVNRSFNLPTLTKYLAASDALSWPREMEYLDADAQYNDFIVTRLRRLDGLDLSELELAHGPKKLDYCLKNAARSLQNETLERVGQMLRLTRKGLFISDAVMSDLMLA